MGRSCLTDVCELVARLGDWFPPEDLGEREDIGDWVMAGDACTAGQNGRLYVEQYAKVQDGKLFLVCMINESPYASVSEFSGAIFAPSVSEWDDLVRECKAVPDGEKDEWHPAVGALKQCFASTPNLQYASRQESVEMFLKDFGISANVLPLDALQQTL